MLANDRILSDSRWFLEIILHEIIHAPSCSLSLPTSYMALSLLFMASHTLSGVLQHLFIGLGHFL